jgi:Flp pilus assembly protein TadD
MGHVEKAVPLLERAVQLAPADATLNDHLGDAYWRAGRKNEARFQWQRALISNPEPDQVAPITAKLKNGLAKNGG